MYIQNWAKQFHIFIGINKTGQIKTKFQKIPIQVQKYIICFVSKFFAPLLLDQGT